MPVRIINLGDVGTRTELAAGLGVPVAAISMVSLLGTATCKTANCPLPPAIGNHRRCILCSQSWFPREMDKKKGKPAVNRRGYGLYGPQFLSKFNGGSNPTSCCCTSSLCEKLGYSHMGMFRFSTKPTKCAEAARVLGLPPCKQKEIVESPRKYKIAPWHFSPLHRTRGTDGKWHLNKGSSFQDSEGKTFSFPPPNANVQTFIDEEALSAGFLRGIFDDALPDWFGTLVRLQHAANENADHPTNNFQSTTEIMPSPQGLTNNNSQSSNGLRSDNHGTTEIPPPPRRRNPKRVHPLTEENADLREQVKVIQARLDSALQHNNEITATVESKNREILQVGIERDELKEEVGRLKKKIAGQERI